MSYPNDQGLPGGAIPVYIVTEPAFAARMVGGGSASKNVSTAGSTLIISGPGVLSSVIVNTGAAGANLKLYDGTDATGNLLATVSGVNAVSLPYGVGFETGLFAVAVNAADYTITYA